MKLITRLTEVIILLLLPLFCLAQNNGIGALQSVASVYDTTLHTHGLQIQMQLPALQGNRYTTNFRLSKKGNQVAAVEQVHHHVDVAAGGDSVLLRQFIPYRNINLLEGYQQDIELEVEVNGQLALNTLLYWYQPRKYRIDIDLQMVQVKQKLEDYDIDITIEERLPDPFFEFYVNGSTVPTYTSEVKQNSFFYDAQTVHLEILQGDTLTWVFYEQDDYGRKEYLGTYSNFAKQGDFQDQVYGVMFGQIKGLSFKVRQTELLPQPITIYNKGRQTVAGKEGVRLLVDYVVSGAVAGQEVLPLLELYDAQNNPLELVYYQALNENTPTVGVPFELKRQGILEYFVPFYAWKDDCKIIRLRLENRESDKELISTPCYLSKPIQFGKYIKYADLQVQEDYVYQQAKGVLLTMDYQVQKIESQADLSLQLNTTARSYLLETDGSHTAVESYPVVIKNAKPKQQVRLFLPYGQWRDTLLQVTLDLTLDYNIRLLQEEVITAQKERHAVTLDWQEQKSGFLKNTYGHLVAYQAVLPALYRQDGLKIEVRATQNGEVFEQYLINNTSTHSDTISEQILIPSRKINSKDKLQLQLRVVDEKNEDWSNLLQYDWEAPAELWNKKIIVSLDKFLPETIDRKDSTACWEYRVQIGDEVALQQPIVNNKINKKIAIKTPLFINREDNIQVYFREIKTGRKVFVWKGDWGKWKQANHQSELKKQFGIRKAKLTAVEID